MNMTTPYNATLCATYVPPSINDVSGIGVRVALYVSVGLGLYIAHAYDQETFRDLARSSFITSTGLAIAGLISVHSQYGLSLVDGFCIATMTSLVILYTFSSFHNRPDLNDMEKDVLHTLTIPLGFSMTWTLIAHTILWTVFGIILWLTVDTFGGAITDSCPNSNIYFWLMGHNIPATNPGLRAAALTLYAAVIIITAPLFYFYIRRAFQEIKKAKEEDKKAKEDMARKLQGQEDRRNTGVLIKQGLHGQQGQVQPKHSPTGGSHEMADMGSQSYQDHSAESSNAAKSSALVDPSKNLSGSASLLNKGSDLEAGPTPAALVEHATDAHPQGGVISDRWKPFVTFLAYVELVLPYLGFGAYIYLIITTEMIIRINGQWSNLIQVSFGQILALGLLLDQIFQIMANLPNSMQHLKDKRDREAREREERETVAAAHRTTTDPADAAAADPTHTSATMTVPNATTVSDPNTAAGVPVSPFAGAIHG